MMLINKKIISLILMTGSISFQVLPKPAYAQSDPEITQKLSDIFFTDAQNGWVIGDSGFIARTTDGGNSWNNSPTSVLDSLTSLFFIDSATGWVGGENGTLLKTTDSGNSWKSITTNSDNIILDIEFANNELGWFSDGTGAYRTTNGGETWEKKIDSLGISFLSVLDTNIVWFAENEFRVHRSSDGGNSVTNIPSGFFYVGICGGRAKDFDMANDFTGLIVGTFLCFNDQGGIDYSPLIIELVSEDSLLWLPFQSQSVGSEPLDAVKFLTEEIVWSVGEFGTIIRSNNGGHSWAQQLSGTETDLFAMSFIDTLTGWVLGKNNLILHTTDGGENWGTLISIESQDYNIPTGFMLKQNYPNPFNPATTISFEIIRPGNIKLSIYDIRGREVFKLIDGFRSSGRYEATWNGLDSNRNEVASGVYFATLRSDEKLIRTIKLILLK